MKNKKFGAIVAVAFALSMATATTGTGVTTISGVEVQAATNTTPSKVILKSAKLSGNSKVVISWKKVKDATNYRVYYKEGSGAWKQIGTTNSTSYTHISSSKFPLKNGKKYIYTVRAYNSKTKKLSTYDTKGKSISVSAAPGTVKLVSAKAVDFNSITVKWNKVPNADKYYVYYKSGNSGWTQIAESTGTSFTHTGLKGNTKYTYTVRAYNRLCKKLGNYDTKGVSAATTCQSHNWIEYSTNYDDVKDKMYECQHGDIYEMITYKCKNCGKTKTEKSLIAEATTEHFRKTDFSICGNFYDKATRYVCDKCGYLPDPGSILNNEEWFIAEHKALYGEDHNVTAESYAATPCQCMNKVFLNDSGEMLDMTWDEYCAEYCSVKYKVMPSSGEHEHLFVFYIDGDLNVYDVCAYDGCNATQDSKLYNNLFKDDSISEDDINTDEDNDIAEDEIINTQNVSDEMNNNDVEIAKNTDDSCSTENDDTNENIVENDDSEEDMVEVE